MIENLQKKLFTLFTIICLCAGGALASDLKIKKSIGNAYIRNQPKIEDGTKVCKLKEGTAVKTTDFRYVDGRLWCKISPEGETKESCKDNKNLWVSGNLLVKSTSKSNMASFEKIKTPENCTCETNHSTKENAQEILGFTENRAIQIINPIKMKPCELEKKNCTCGGLKSNYGYRRHPITQKRKLHTGIDFSAPIGTAIYAVSDGIMTLASNYGGYGNRIVVEHYDSTKSLKEQLAYNEKNNPVSAQDGQLVSIESCGVKKMKQVNSLQSTYNHLYDFAPKIKTGQLVKKGDLLGYVGDTGLSTAPHLHFEILVDGLDPSIESPYPYDPRMFGKFPKVIKEWSRTYTCHTEGLHEH